MGKIFCASILLVASLIMISCNSSTSPDPVPENYIDAINYSIEKLLYSVEEIPLNKYPFRTKGLGQWEVTEPSAWTSGFFPGCLWYANELKSDSILYQNAILFTDGLEEQKFNTGSHDIGFIINNSFGLGYKYTNNESYKEIILQAANSLATRFNDNVGCLQSWDGEFQVIIDNMMNLEILFWASKNGGNSEFYDIAVSHANKTIQNHIREDGGSFHVVQYDPESGNVIQQRTHAGYADNSTWARGQAWGGVFMDLQCAIEKRIGPYI